MNPTYPTAAAILLTLASEAFAQEMTRSSTNTNSAIEEVLVKGQIMNQTDSAYSSSRFDTSKLRDQKISKPEQIFAQVPGMSVRDYGLGGVANSFTIRGFGDGGHGGDLGVVIDGIPLNEAMSHADGYVDMNVIVPLEINTMTVFKGPVSTLYGNYNRGGLIKFDTRKSGDYTELDISGGSDGLLDAQGVYGVQLTDSQQLNLAVQHHQTDGFRPQSDGYRNTLAGRYAIELTDKTQIALAGRWHDADSDSASYLTETDYQRDAYGINANVQNDGAEKTFSTMRVDVSHQLSSDLQLLAFAYGTEQDFTRWFSRPVGDGVWRQREESYDREVTGFGVSLNGQQTVGEEQFTWVAGLETYNESTDYLYYDGLDNRQRISPAVNNRRSDLDSTSAFAEVKIDGHPLFQPSLGLRYDRFDGECVPLGTETGTTPCSELNNLDNVSPKLGVRSQWTDAFTARASFSEGFALPSGWIKYQPDASNLDPVTFQQYELGFSWAPNASLLFDVAVFQVDSDGEVRTVDTGIYENYGETERTGMETTLSWTPISSLSLSAVYGLNDSEVVKNSDPALIGKEVGGVSDYSATLSAEWLPVSDWTVSLSWRSVGGYALNADNSAYADSYDLMDIAIDWQMTPQVSLYAQLGNLTDEEYAPSRFMFGGENLFSTGAPRQLKLGIQLSL